MSFDNNSFYDDNSTKNWQPQPTPMEDRRRRHTGKWITAILILGLLALAVTGTVHLVRDVGVTINRRHAAGADRSNRADADSKGNGTVRSDRSACADAAGRRGAAAADNHAVACRRADRRLR